MTRAAQEVGREHDAPTAQKSRSIRFSAAGKPELYLPLFDPKQDPAFMRAVSEKRVLSIRQDPTSKRSDFATVGLDEGKYTMLLIFPKSLAQFCDARVIGIKYEAVAESRTASPMPRSLKLSKRRAEKPPRASTRRELPSTKTRVKPETPAPPKRVEPQPKEFRVRVRITTVTVKDVTVKDVTVKDVTVKDVTVKDVTVKAMTKAEAKEKATAEFRDEGEARAVSLSEV